MEDATAILPGHNAVQDTAGQVQQSPTLSLQLNRGNTQRTVAEQPLEDTQQNETVVAKAASTASQVVTDHRRSACLLVVCQLLHSVHMQLQILLMCVWQKEGQVSVVDMRCKAVDCTITVKIILSVAVCHHSVPDSAHVRLPR